MINKEQAKQAIIAKGKTLLERYNFDPLVKEAIENFDIHVDLSIQYKEKETLILTIEHLGFTWTYSIHTDVLTVFI
jgi:hypothetical protein